MIISHRLKFAFFRSPKTGSTTTEVMLRMSGLFDIDKDICSPIPRFGLPGDERAIAHMTPTEAIAAGLLTIEQARTYMMRVTLRDPLARAVSAFTHANSKFNGMNHIDMFSIMTLRGDSFQLLEKPQVDYFLVGTEQVCKPVDFRNFADSVKSLIKDIGELPGAGTPLDFGDVPNFNVTERKPEGSNRRNWVENNPDPKVKRTLQAKFAPDIHLWEWYYGDLG